jgi:hypothetical protein
MIDIRVHSNRRETIGENVVKAYVRALSPESSNRQEGAITKKIMKDNTPKNK